MGQILIKLKGLALCSDKEFDEVFMVSRTGILGLVLYFALTTLTFAGPLIWPNFNLSVKGVNEIYQERNRRLTACEQSRQSTHEGSTDDHSLLHPPQRQALAKSYCSALHGVMSEEQASSDCKFVGGQLHARCGFLKLLDDERLLQLRSVVGANGQQKVERCMSLIEEFFGRTLIVKDCVLSNSATRLADKQEGVDRRQVILDTGTTRDCSDASTTGELTDNSVAPRQCNEFKDTPLSGTEFDQVFSRFIIGYKDFSTSALRFNPMNWGSKGACLSCFKSKYETVQQLGRLDYKDFATRQKQVRNKIFSNFAVRKMEEALSEFLKAVERQRFMHATFDVPLQDCEAMKKIDSQIAKCSSGDHFRSVTDEFRRRHVGVEEGGVGALLGGAVKRYEALIEKSEMARGCGMDVQYGSYVSFLQKKIATDNYAPSKLVTPDVRAGLQRCGESDQSCFIEVIINARLRGINPESESGKMIAQDVRSQFRQPFFRSLLSDRQSLLYYGESGDITSLHTYKAYIEENRDRFAAVGQKDFEVACRAFVNNVSLALCTNESDASKNFSGEGYKNSLAELLKTNGDANDPRAQGDNLIQLAVACELLNEGSASDLLKGIHESRAAADQVADRGHIADVLLRFGNVLPQSNSDKQRSYFEDFAEDSCRAAQESHRLQTVAFGQKEKFDSNKRYRSARDLPQTSFDVSTLSGRSYLSGTELRFVPNIASFDVSSSALRLSQTASNQNENAVLSLYNSSWHEEHFGQSGGESVSSVGSFMGDLRGANHPNKHDSNNDYNFVGPLWDPQTMATSEELDLSVSSLKSDDDLPSGLMQGKGEVAGQIGVGHGPASVAAFGGAFGFANIGQPREIRDAESLPRRASERHIEELEERQSRIERQLLAQAEESTALTDLRRLAQIEQLRLELERIRVSNQQLMSSMKTLGQPRREKAQENLFDQIPASDLSRVAATDEVSVVRGPARAIATFGTVSRGERAPVSRSSFSEASAPQAAVTTVAKASGEVAVASATAPQAAATSVSVARAGTQVASANRLIASASTSFSPSTGLSRTITGDTPVESLPQEKKIELIREFLSYVEKNPVHREGRYLGDNNDQITIDYEGRMMIVRVDDIQDQEVRQQLQERLARQRLAINQTVRASRLESLRRLLASSRGGN